MSEKFTAQVAALDAPTLMPLVERALGVSVCRVYDWRVKPVSGGFAAPVWRLQGYADLPSGQASWSLILKVPSTEVQYGDPWGGVREPAVYSSGFRSPVADRLRLPHCYGVVEQTEGRPWIWLEDVRHDPSPKWTAARYVEVARCLGRFNGAFMTGHPLPAWPWLDAKSQLHQLVDIFLPAPDSVAAGACFWHEQGDSAAAVLDRYADFYACHQDLLVLVDRLPLTLCHGDTLQRNLLVRETPGADLEVVAIDWSQTGMSVPGADAAHMISMAAGFAHIIPGQMPELDRVVFPAYVQGLRDAGWQGDERLVRLGYAAASALWDGLILVGSMTLLYRLAEERAWMPSVFGWPAAEIGQYWLAMLEYHLKLADEARQLAGLL